MQLASESAHKQLELDLANAKHNAAQAAAAHKSAAASWQGELDWQKSEVLPSCLHPSLSLLYPKPLLLQLACQSAVQQHCLVGGAAYLMLIVTDLSKLRKFWWCAFVPTAIWSSSCTCLYNLDGVVVTVCMLFHVLEA